MRVLCSCGGGGCFKQKTSTVACTLFTFWHTLKMAGLDLHIPDKTIYSPTLFFILFYIFVPVSHILANISTYTHAQCRPNGKCTAFYLSRCKVLSMFSMPAPVLCSVVKNFFVTINSENKEVCNQAIVNYTMGTLYCFVYHFVLEVHNSSVCVNLLQYLILCLIKTKKNM